MKPETIMIVQPNTDMRDTLRHAFEDRGYLTWSCPNFEMAMCLFEAVHPGVILMDIDTTYPDPYSLVDRWKERAPGVRVIVESGLASGQKAKEAMDHGASAFVAKTIPVTALFRLLDDGRFSPPAMQSSLNREAA